MMCADKINKLTPVKPENYTENTNKSHQERGQLMEDVRGQDGVYNVLRALVR